MTFTSRISPISAEFAQNRVDMLGFITHMRDLEARAEARSMRRAPTFEKRNQLPPYERLRLLLDPGAPFLRLFNMANYLVDDPDPDTSIPGGSIICGIGYVSGTRCMVWVDDSGISAGAMTTKGLNLTLEMLKMTKAMKLPLVHCVESAGADLVKFKVESWVDAGAVFARLAHLSAAGLPTIAVLHGGSTAGGAYMPGLSDYVIGVKKNGMAALASVGLVKAATGEDADAREMGGTEMHATTSGLVEYLAESDAHAIGTARDLVAKLGWNTNRPQLNTLDFAPPKHNPDELAGVVPTDYRTPYDVREVITRLVDASDFMEFKPDYGPGTVCVQASIMGMPVQIIGNNGPIDPQGATKAAQFYQLADQSQKPMIFLHNTTGFIVGTESEQAGMVKHGSKMVQGAANIRVPKITLHLGASFGAGNYAMCGWAYEPDFCFSWPNSRSNVMGGEQAGKTMSLVARTIAARKGEKPDEDAIIARENRIIEHFTSQESAFYTSGRVLDHGVIDPRDTRNVLGMALDICRESKARQVQPNAFGVARL
jgi:geranyl-CoA carboxylase beta subunit